MDVFDLSAKLSLDSKDYDRSLQNASSTADQWATKFAMAAKAVSSAISGISSLIDSSVKAFSNFQQLEGGVQTLFGTGGKGFEEWSKSFDQSSNKMQDYADAARKVLNGDFGVGAERKDLLAAAGYDPDTVQQMVNNLINGVDIASGLSVDTIASNMQTAEEKYASLQRAQDQVMENARNAYKTAGLSANEYMETATSFSASLLQGLGGDTEKAAAYADRAIRDMSDNANKMGTDMGAIQSAYQGFAKQNYTMLDNLKLGYGGTKEEMARLIKDAAALTDVQAELGVTVDANSMSFDNIINAINVMQNQMGIAGTTSEEAEKTIEGSTKMMKSAWQNMLTAMVTGGDWFDESINRFVDSAKIYVQNLLPAIEGAMHGFAALISSLAPMLAQELPGFVAEVLPDFVNAVSDIISGLLDALPGVLTALTASIPMVIDSLVNLVPDLIAFILEGIPLLVDAGYTLLTSLVDGLTKNVGSMLPNLTTMLMDMVDSLIELITGNQINLVTAGAALITELANGITDSISIITEKLPELITDIVSWLTNTDNLSQMLDAAISIFGAIVSNVPQILISLTQGLYAIVTGIATYFTEHGDEILNGLKQAFVNAGAKFSEVWNEQIKPAFEDLGTKMKDFFLQFEWGETLVSFVEKIASFFTDLWRKIKGAFEGEDGIGSKIKNFFTNFSWGDAVTAFINGLKSAFTGAWDLLKDIFTGVQGLAGKIKSWFGEISLFDSINQLIENVKKDVEGIWEGVRTWFKEKIEGLFDNIKLPSWLNPKNWFGGGKDKEESIEDSGMTVDMPENMLTLDYDNLQPIPDATLESYQSLRDAIVGINTAISGGEESEGLSVALSSLPEAFGEIQSSSESLAGYFGGGFTSSINELKKQLAVFSTDDEGNFVAGKGNTLFNALGSISGVLEDIDQNSHRVAETWKGTFKQAVDALKRIVDKAMDALEDLSASAVTAGNAFAGLAQQIRDAISALKEFNSLDTSPTPSGGGRGHEDLFKAEGGAVHAGQSYIVGEEGWEVFSPTRDGYIIPHDQAAGKGVQVVVNFNGDVIGDADSISGYVTKAAKEAIWQEVYVAA